MTTPDCQVCDRLREAYRCATRRELDLKILRDAAAIRNDTVRLQDLGALLVVASGERDSASRSILDHEASHRGLSEFQNPHPWTSKNSPNNKKRAAQA